MNMKFEICGIIAENDAIGQRKFESIMNACKMIYDPSNLFYKRYRCLRMLVNAVANLTNVLRMK